MNAIRRLRVNNARRQASATRVKTATNASRGSIRNGGRYQRNRLPSAPLSPIPRTSIAFRRTLRQSRANRDTALTCLNRPRFAGGCFLQVIMRPWLAGPAWRSDAPHPWCSPSGANVSRRLACGGDGCVQLIFARLLRILGRGCQTQQRHSVL